MNYSALKTRKGITSAVSSILLIGVAVFGIGTVYAVVQTQMSDWQSDNEAPRLDLVLKSAASSTDTGMYCANGDGGIVIQHQGGEPITFNRMEIVIRTESGPQAMRIQPTSDKQLSSGENLGVFQTRTTTPRVAHPSTNYCNTVSTDRSNQVNVADEVSVDVVYVRSGEIMLDGSLEAASTLRAYPY